MSRAVGRRVDRRIAWWAFGLAVLVFVVVAARNDAPVPLAAIRDPDAAARLFAQMRAGERIDTIVDWELTRTIPGVRGGLHTNSTDARWGEIQLTRAADTLVIETPKISIDCQLVGNKSACASGQPETSVAPSRVLELATTLGTYDVTPLPDTSIAGERTECFRIRTRESGRELPGLGEETDICLASDGVVLRSRREGITSTEDRIAQRVDRVVTRDTLLPILKGFDGAEAFLHQ